MSVPIFSYAANVTTNIGICQILAPLPWSMGSSGTLTPQTQLEAPVIDLASFLIVTGSGSANMTMTFQELSLTSVIASGSLSATWQPLTTGGVTSTPLVITAAASTSYGGILNGPFHGLRILIASAAGNGVAYARITATIRMA